VILAHRIKLTPKPDQAAYFAQACGTARFTWNWALAEWNAQYARGLKPNAKDLKRQFNAIKYEHFPWIAGIHRDAHAQPFAALAQAWNRYFASLKKHKRGEIGRPKFKKKGKCRNSFYVANDKFSLDGTAIRLPVIGRVRMTEVLRFAGKIQSATVSRDADRWFISIIVDVPIAPPATPSGAPIGVDFGITTFAALSTGEKTESPRPLRKAQRRLRRLGRWHSRKRLKSQSRRKAVMRLARQHRRVANIRQDFLHKFTTALAKANGEICIEDLYVKGMVKNHNLALHISDAAWGEARRQLEYKAALYGSTITVRPRFYPSSQLCSACGAKASAMPLAVRTWACQSCGAVHDRDYNAANNLLQLPRATREVTPPEIAALARGSAARETAVGERGTELWAHKSSQER
jgi:putative transposase